jgi:DNA-binding NtrC family response regulator
MSDGPMVQVVVAHRRAPVLRMLRANLHADGLGVHTTSTAAGCLAALHDETAAALVLDADLLRDDVPYSGALLERLRVAGVPLLIVSFDPADRAIARSLQGARFLCRADDIDEVLRLVHHLLADSVRPPSTAGRR